LGCKEDEEGRHIGNIKEKESTIIFNQYEIKNNVKNVNLRNNIAKCNTEYG